MPRDAYQRMDVDTHWVYHHKMRALQRAYPDEWPTFACGWLALLGEAWRAMDRTITLAQAMPPALQVDSNRLRLALFSVRLIDRYGRIPEDSWAEWTGPQARRTQSARNAAASRWQSEGNANSQPASQPVLPPTPAKRGNGTPRANGTNPRSLAKAAEAAARERTHLRQMAYLRGELTQDELTAMAKRDGVPGGVDR